jgi:cell division protein FtsB
MSLTRKKAMKFLLISICILGPLAAWLVFGEYGLNRLHRKEMERQAYLENIRRLREENQALMEEANRLRHDRNYIESVVRNELHLVKPDEIVYRSKKKAEEESDVKRSTRETQQENKGEEKRNERGTR